MKGGKVGCGVGKESGTALLTAVPCGCCLVVLSPPLLSLPVALFSVFFFFLFLHGIRRFGWDTFATLGGSYVPKRLELALLLYNTRAILHIYVLCEHDTNTSTVMIYVLGPAVPYVYLYTLCPSLRRS